MYLPFSSTRNLDLAENYWSLLLCCYNLLFFCGQGASDAMQMAHYKLTIIIINKS